MRAVGTGIRISETELDRRHVRIRPRVAHSGRAGVKFVSMTPLGAPARAPVQTPSSDDARRTDVVGIEAFWSRGPKSSMTAVAAWPYARHHGLAVSGLGTVGVQAVKALHPKAPQPARATVLKEIALHSGKPHHRYLAVCCNCIGPTRLGNCYPIATRVGLIGCPAGSPVQLLVEARGIECSRGGRDYGKDRQGDESRDEDLHGQPPLTMRSRRQPVVDHRMPRGCLSGVIRA